MTLLQLESIAARISLIPGRNQGRYPYCHSLLVEDERTILIDPASDPEILKELARTRRIDALVLSHYHEDHFWFSYLFPQAELWAPELDAAALESLDRLLDEYRMEGSRRETWRKILVDNFHFEGRRIARRLRDGDRIRLGELEMEVLHTPGHTPGHSCFRFPGPGVVFLADNDLTRFGPWYGDRGSDIDQVIQSAKRIAGLGHQTFVAAHERSVYAGTIAAETAQYLAVIEAREDRLRQLLREPKTLEEILAGRIIYRKPREPKDFYEFGEWSMITKHLERMEKRGELRQEAGKYRCASI